MDLLLLFLMIIVGIGVGFLVYLFLKKREKEYISESLKMSLFLVLMPKHDVEGKRENQRKEKMLIGQMEQVLTNFLSLRKPNIFEKIIYGEPRVALEIASQIGGKDICFYVAVPHYIESSFEKYVQGVYDRAIVEKVNKDYTIFEPEGKTSGCYLDLSRSNFLPISTYKKLEKDPLASTTNALSKIKANEGAAIQIIIKNSNRSWKGLGQSVLAELKKGKSFRDATFDVHKSFFAELLEEVFKIFIPSGKKPKTKQQNNVDEKTIKAVQEKTQKPIFDANIRILTSALSQARSDQILNHIESSFSQFSLFAPNSFQMRKVENKKLRNLVYDFSFRNFNKSQRINLNIEELTSVYHFPTYYLETPYIKSIKSTGSEPPINLPKKGINLLGEVNFRGEKKKVMFANKADRRRHSYFVGQTGTGKSGLLREMIRHDIENGEGVAVIDPHGDLIKDTLANIPKERMKDVVLFDPSDIERPIGLNMLEWKMEVQKDFAVQEMISIFYKLFSAESMGPIFEHSMRNAMLAVMADKDNPGTLIDVSRIFKDEEYLDRQLKKVKNPMVRRYWTKEWKQSGAGEKAEMTTYVVSKIGRFIENNIMKNIIGQRRSGFDLTKIMDEGKIFLANLSKGSVGEMNTSLLGCILVSKIQMGVMKRNKIPEKERKDFYLYIDEFQNFTTDSIATILSEARKYHLNLILAHQYIPQLKDEIREAVLGNTGTIGSLRVGAKDAEFLESQFQPSFSRFDLVNLSNFKAIIKMMLNGSASKPFKVDLIEPKEGNYQQIKKIKQISRMKYGRPKSIVDKEASI